MSGCQPAMNAPTLPSEFKKQHLIDPEICIRCNTCEATCPVGAVTHDDVQLRGRCGQVQLLHGLHRAVPDRIDRQLAHRHARLLARRAVRLDRAAAPGGFRRGGRRRGARPSRARSARCWSRRTPAPAASRWRRHRPPRPVVNLFTRGKPAIATVQGNYRITAPGSSSDVRHIVLSFGAHRLSRAGGPVDRHRRRRASVPTASPHDIRLYSIASARDGEKRNANNVSLTVKRSRGRRRLQLPVRSQGRRQGAGDGPVRRDLPDAERPQLQHPDDLYRHRLGAVPRLHRAPPPRRARCARHA